MAAQQAAPRHGLQPEWTHTCTYNGTFNNNWLCKKTDKNFNRESHKNRDMLWFGEHAAANRTNSVKINCFKCWECIERSPTKELPRASAHLNTRNTEKLWTYGEMKKWMVYESVGIKMVKPQSEEIMNLCGIAHSIFERNR